MTAIGSMSRLAGALLLASVLGGCGIVREATPAEDNLSTWSDHPLPPDQALASRVIAGNSACSTADAAGQAAPIRILLQDRRTQQTAAFLVTTATTFGSCMVTSGSGMSGGGAGPLPGALVGIMSIDENSTGGVGSGDTHLLGGRLDARVAQIAVNLADGRAVVASVGNGYWLAWWPGTTAAKAVTATDATGAPIATLDASQ